MEICLLLVQRRAAADHLERLIAETVDELGRICLSRNGKRRRQHGKKRKSTDPQKRRHRSRAFGRLRTTAPPMSCSTKGVFTRFSLTLGCIRRYTGAETPNEP